MTFLPIAQRELRVAARRRNTYRTRFLAALVALIISIWIYTISSRGMPTSMLSRSIFTGLATVSFGYCLLAGTRATADCLSEEKRDGTLGLLFLTDLKGYDIVAGKLAATSLNSLYGLMAVLPVLAIPLLIGGIGMDVFGRTALTLLNTLFFSLTAGLLISSICRQERKAMAGTLALVLFFAGGIPLAGVTLAEYLHVSSDEEFIRPFLLFSPGYNFGVAALSNLGGGGPPQTYYWWSLAIIHLLGWLFLFLGCRIVPRSWQDKAPTVRAVRWRDRWQQWCHGDSAQRRALRTTLLEINPILWLSGRDRLQRALVWGFLGLLGAGFFWGYIELQNDWLTAAVAIMSAYTLHLTLKVWLASESCRRFMDDRREGAIELLLSTPLSVREIIRGQLLAMRRLFGGPLVAVLVADLFLIWMGMRDVHNTNDQNSLVLAFIYGIIVLVADLVTIAWVGMWLGLSAKNARNASSGVVLRILLAPWIIFAASMTVYGVWLAAYMRGSSSLEAPVAMTFWLMISLAVDVFYGRLAFLKLHHSFRALAMARYQPAARRRWWRPW